MASCAWCGGPLGPNPRQRYCSVRCRVAAHRGREGDAARAEIAEVGMTEYLRRHGRLLDPGPVWSRR